MADSETVLSDQWLRYVLILEKHIWFEIVMANVRQILIYTSKAQSQDNVVRGTETYWEILHSSGPFYWGSQPTFG